jgi:hypothetical protein
VSIEDITMKLCTHSIPLVRSINEQKELLLKEIDLNVASIVAFLEYHQLDDHQLFLFLTFSHV